MSKKIIYYSGQSNGIKWLLTQLTKAMAHLGTPVTCVLHDYPKASHHRVISVAKAMPTELVPWVVQALKVCQPHQSLSHRHYTGKGEIPIETITASPYCLSLYIDTRGIPRLTQDINTSPSPIYRHNQVLRVVDSIQRNKANLPEHLQDLANAYAIEDYNPQEDYHFPILSITPAVLPQKIKLDLSHPIPYNKI